MQASELRKSPRLKAIKSGQVVIRPSGYALECTIRNISATGALIRFDDDVDLPEKVELIIVSHNIHVQADVVWNTRSEAGLEFRPGAIDEPE